MKRDLRKNIIEYETLVKKGQFHHSDLLTAEEMFELFSITKENNTNSSNLVYDAILTAWNAGYMSGYKRGIRSDERSL